MNYAFDDASTIKIVSKSNFFSFCNKSLWKTLQDDLCVSKSSGGPQTTSYNDFQAPFWAREGRYSNAVKLLTCTGIADKNDDSAFQELLESSHTQLF